MHQPIRTSRALVAGAVALVFAASASAQLPTPVPQARVERAAPGTALATATGGALRDAVASRLAARGNEAATAQSMVETARSAASGGRTHVRLEQLVGGLTVYGSAAKATFNDRGELVHLVDQLARVPAGAPRSATIGERQALDAAMARVHPDVRVNFASGARLGKAVRFAGGGFFHNDPEVTRVLVPQADGSLAEGFVVQTWTQRGNLLDHTLVDGQGAVLNVERRTANDSYNVYAVDPAKGPQTVISGPGAGNAQSPIGWLGTGTQTTININGNNVSAYLDANANNAPDTGGTTVSGGNFTTAASLTTSPTTTGNRAVAVQNLFYLNNRIHDILYGHGFVESVGNFQINNFGQGGAGNDPVNAEAQDGGGTDNANFATPADGSRPRMQMYLWTGAGPTHEVVIGGGPTYNAVQAQFGSTLTTTGLTGTIVLGNDGVAAAGGGTVNDGCEALPSSVRGRIVLLDRGFCAFTVKVQNASRARASGVIIANNAGGTDIFAMGGTLSVRIPAVMIGQNDGADLKARVSVSGTMRKKTVQPLQIDGDLDSDIVYHEYGHGLTWRMIGSMSGPLAGAIGEGASDVVAFLVNGDDVIGEYAASNALGIRRYRYAGYPLTYGDVTGAGVHNDGEIYAAAMWRLRELWLGSGRGNDSLFTHFVDGMNYTPASPKFEDMRRGMLSSIAASAGTDATARCALVWQAFAQYGIGAGATGTVLGSTSVSISPSFVARSDCSLN